MATADSSQPSTLANSSHKAGRQSPPPPTKRDKKRQLLNDRLAELETQYAKDRDRHYREELQKIQVDVNLVGRVDPYADRPLDEIEREYRELSQATSTNGDRAPTRSLLEMAGPSFQEWVRTVEDLVEHRDYELTTQKVSMLRLFSGTRN